MSRFPQASAEALNRVQSIKSSMNQFVTTNKRNQDIVNSINEHITKLNDEEAGNFTNYRDYAVTEPTHITSKTFAEAINRQRSVKYFGLNTLEFVWCLLGGSSESFKTKFLKDVGYDVTLKQTNNSKQRRRPNRSNARPPKKNKYKKKAKKAPTQFTKIYRKEYQEFECKYKQLEILSECSKKKIKPSPNAVARLLNLARCDDWESYLSDTFAVILVSLMVWYNNQSTDVISKTKIEDMGSTYITTGWKNKPVINSRGSLLFLTKIFDDKNKFTGNYKINNDFIEIFKIWIKMDNNKIFSELKSRKEKSENNEDGNENDEKSNENHENENNASNEKQSENNDNESANKEIEKKNYEEPNETVDKNKENSNVDEFDSVNNIDEYTMSDINDPLLIECLKYIFRSSEISINCLQYLVANEFEFEEFEEFEADELKQFVLKTLSWDILKYKRLIKYIKNKSK